MAIDFPSSPVTGQQYTYQGVVYTFTTEGVWAASPPGLSSDLYAPINSPTFTGDPKAPTPAPADADTSIATTAYVQANLGNYAPLLSPGFSGTPTAPTPTAGNNSSRLATTAFVSAALTTAAAPLDALAYNGIQFNGSMEVSQQNGTSVVSVFNSNKFIVDSWQIYLGGTAQTLSGQQVGPAFGPFASYLHMGVTVANAAPGAFDTVSIMQTLEGYRASRLGFGTASAQPVSIGFWVRSAARTGILPGALRNGLADRCYSFTVTVNAVATWEYKTVTIPGDTTGTWTTDSIKGFNFMLSPLVASSVATPAGVWTSGNFHGAPGGTNFVQSTSDAISITGVVILPGSQAPTAAQSALIMRPFDNELELCQRHWEKSYNYTDLPGAATNLGIIGAGTPTGTGITNFSLAIPFGTAKRAAPTLVLYSGTGVAAQFSTTSAGSDSVATATATGISRKSFVLGNTGTSTNIGVFSHYVADARP